METDMRRIVCAIGITLILIGFAGLVWSALNPIPKSVLAVCIIVNSQSASPVEVGAGEINEREKRLICRIQ